MDLRNLIPTGRRRKLVDLRFRPGLQLKLPALLIAITAGFCLLFAAHTEAAYGALARIGLEGSGLQAFAEEIRQDYFVVSTSIALAYVFVVVGACLAGTHRLLGPISVLQRQLAELKQGRYSGRVQLRAGHPLAVVARELNELADRLQHEAGQPGSSLQVVPSKEDRVAAKAGEAVDRLIEVYALDRTAEPEREAPRLVTAAG